MKRSLAEQLFPDGGVKSRPDKIGIWLNLEHGEALTIFSDYRRGLCCAATNGQHNPVGDYDSIWLFMGEETPLLVALARDLPGVVEAVAEFEESEAA